MEEPKKTETEPKTEPRTREPEQPEIDPERRLNPDRLCDQQKREIVRTIKGA